MEDIITSETVIKPDPELGSLKLELCQEEAAEAEDSSYSDVDFVEPEFCGIKVEPWVEQLYRDESNSVKSPEQQYEEVDLVSDEDDEILILSSSSRSCQTLQKKGVECLKKDSEKKTYSCATCSETFSKHSQFTNHMLRHILEKPFECTEGHDVISQEGPNANMVLDRKFLPCFECFKTHRLRWGQQNRKKVVPNGGEKPYECFTCQKSFYKYSELKEHMASHEDNNLYSCNKCKQTFTKKVLLERHTSIHKKLHICTVCKKNFRALNQLEKHLRVHSDWIFCKLCLEGLKTVGSYRKHLIAHINGEK